MVVSSIRHGSPITLISGKRAAAAEHPFADARSSEEKLQFTVHGANP